MSSKHPLLNRKVRVVWVDGECQWPQVLYVAYTGDGFVRLVDNNTWADAEFDLWIPTSEILSIEVLDDAR
jgi:hypothetical protein